MGTDGQLTVDLDDDAALDPAHVGGKGAALAALRRIEGVRVPDGWCVTAAAHATGVVPRDAMAARVRAGVTYAVRSSAVGEDGDAASFAWQHASVLGVVGADAVAEAVARVWSSLEDSVAYRDARGATATGMAVVVQEQVDAEQAGVLFTADPATGHRGVSVVEGVAGLAGDLVAGRVDVTPVRVRDGEPAGDARTAELVALGRRIEKVFGTPQDIEWCRDADGLAVVQSRPITTLFPVPTSGGDGPRVYLSVGHQQMMTDPLRPLGLSVWQLHALPVMHEAGGRLWVEVADRLRDPALREPMLALFETADPLTGTALREVLAGGLLGALEAPVAAGAAGAPPEPTIAADPAIVDRVVARIDATVDAARERLAGVRGPGVFAAIREDIAATKAFHGSDPEARAALMAGLDSAAWLDEHLQVWLGIPRASDALSRAVPGDVTAEMGLALLDVADVVRPWPAVVDALTAAAADGDDAVLDRLDGLPGGPAARVAIAGWLARYGVRGPGEIDITRPRWGERPSLLLGLLLAAVHGAEPGAAAARIAEGDAVVRAAREDVLTRLRALPDGEAKAAAAERRIDLVRVFAGYREYPKFGIVRRLAVYKDALRQEIEGLVARGVLACAEDADWLRFEELETAVRDGRVDRTLLDARRRAHARHERLTPPRVLTSEGECLTGHPPRDGDLPAGALAGLAVSSGVVEGRARIVERLEDADVQSGDILVTRFTDPSWAPLFVSVAGLVCEVGGLMTHGAVVAREYGLPAVVSVPDATARIPDGHRIRVDGTRGVVELL